MKVVRILISIIILFIFICVVAVGILVFTFDPNKLKPIIAAEVMNKTGYQLAIEDKLSWSFYPLLGVKISRMTISDPNQRNPWADLQDVTIAAKLSELIQGNKQLNGDVHIGALRLMNLHAQNARVHLLWQNNVLVLQSINASLYEGTLTGTANGSDLETLPKWNWNVQFNHIQLNPLLLDVNGANTKIRISGLGNVRFQGATRGVNRNQLITNLNGTTDFNVTNGAVEGLDLNYFIETADALLNKIDNGPQPVNTNQTHFNSLVGSAVIKNGLATTNNLVLSAPAFTAVGQGSVDLVNQALNGRLQVSTVQTAKTQWVIPIIVTGDLYSPTVRLDMLTLKTMIAREQVEKIKSKVQQEIKKLPEKANKFLKKLLGN